MYDKIDRKLTEARSVIRSIDASKRVAVDGGGISPSSHIINVKSFANGFQLFSPR